jgi:hypothetical protein
MWFTFVTITTCGYGDMVPSTIVGRSIAVLSAILGLFLTATLIGLLCEGLNLSPHESRVVNFIKTNQKSKLIKSTALNCVVQTVRTYIKMHYSHSSETKKKMRSNLAVLAQSFKKLRA